MASFRIKPDPDAYGFRREHLEADGPLRSVFHSRLDGWEGAMVRSFGPILMTLARRCFRSVAQRHFKSRRGSPTIFAGLVSRSNSSLLKAPSFNAASRMVRFSCTARWAIRAAL